MCRPILHRLLLITKGTVCFISLRAARGNPTAAIQKANGSPNKYSSLSMQPVGTHWCCLHPTHLWERLYSLVKDQMPCSAHGSVAQFSGYNPSLQKRAKCRTVCSGKLLGGNRLSQATWFRPSSSRACRFQCRIPIREAQRPNYMTLQDYINAVIVPEMQVKLRQGFGRAIRTETDTCVVSILDHRAALGGKYHQEVMEALPPVPVTRQIEDVEQFIRARKGPDYFFVHMGGKQCV